MSENISIRVIIKGRVQGVWYRGWTVDAANRLELDGWVRNRPDGTVEALFSGPETQVRIMIELCRKGPPLARVDTITEHAAEPPEDMGFLQMPTR